MGAGHAALISRVYAAGIGRVRWADVLSQVASHWELADVQLIAFGRQADRLSWGACAVHTGQLQTLEYLARQIFAGRDAAQLRTLAVGQWHHACHPAVHTVDTQLVSSVGLPTRRGLAQVVRFVSSSEHGPLSEQKQHALSALCLHISESLVNATHLQDSLTESVVARAMLGQFHRPVFLVDEACHLQYANDAGRSMLSEGEHLHDTNGVLHFVDPEGSKGLTDAIAGLVRHAGSYQGPGEREVSSCSAGGRNPARGPRAAFRVAMGGQYPAACVASVLEPQHISSPLAHGPWFLLAVHDWSVKADDITPELVADCLDVSLAEARVAVLLAQGLSPGEIARARHVAESTVRTQIKSVRNKLSLSRLSEIGRLIHELRIS